MLRFIPLLFLAVGVAHASVPAPLVGIWKLEGPARPTGPMGVVPTVELTLANGTLRGSYGCARFGGAFTAARHAASFDAKLLPPAPNERCTFAADASFVRELNASTTYVVTRDRLLLISGQTRLSFRRVGFVTPVRN